MNRYLGHPSQLYGAEEHRLVGGKGDGMRLFEIRNGRGLELTVSADRCADIARLTFKGDNMGYFAPSGYVSPAYYDREGDGFLKSFTAGFLGHLRLTTVGRRMRMTENSCQCMEQLETACRKHLCCYR